VFISGESSRRHDAIHAGRQVGAVLDIKIGLIGLWYHDRRQVGIVSMLDIKIGVIGLWYCPVLSTMLYIGDKCSYND